MSIPWRCTAASRTTGLGGTPCWSSPTSTRRSASDIVCLTADEVDAAAAAGAQLADEPPFSPLLPARPDEEIAPGNNNIIGPRIYGARTYGDLMVDRQTLSFVRLCARSSANSSDEMRAQVSATTTSERWRGTRARSWFRKLRYSTREASPLQSDDAGGHRHLPQRRFDHVLVRLLRGRHRRRPGTWESHRDERRSHAPQPILAGLTATPTRGRTRHRRHRCLSRIRRSSAVVTDPPYDQMIAYADRRTSSTCGSSARSSTAWPELAITADPHGAQEKLRRSSSSACGAKRPTNTAPATTTTRRSLEAFREMRRVVAHDGLVTIVFGHGEPEVWQRLLAAIDAGRSGDDRVVAGQHRVRGPTGQGQHRDDADDGLPPGARRPRPRAGRAPSRPRSRRRSGAGIRTGSAGGSRPPTC